MLFAGYLGDKLNLFLAKRHGGTHKPEDSLASFVFPTLVSAIGIIIYALTAQHPETHSYWGIVMGICHFPLYRISADTEQVGRCTSSALSSP